MAKVELKQVVVNEIKEKLEKATSAVLVDARGLTVEQDTKLRKQLREAGVDYKVYKNTMMNFAVQGTEFEGLKDYFEGPSAIAICYEDPTVAAGILNKFMKEAKALEFKAGVIEGTCYDAKGMAAVADIPSREVLLSKLLGSFKSPMGNFARVIQAIADKQPEAAEA
ncbi:MAG: 50S ribosomal protein L10 [Firmicutes bacterium]|nr:50S ribosomal protein L10 [Bacillota bacterium]